MAVFCSVPKNCPVPNDPDESTAETALLTTAGMNALDYEVPSRSRLGMVLMHSTYYAFMGQARLAKAVGVSRSTISRLVRGRTRPSLALAQSVADVLSRDLKVPLQPSDLFSEDGCYKEPSGCRLCACSGCFPDEAYDHRNKLRPAFLHMRPGDWSRSPVRSDRNSPALQPGKEAIEDSAPATSFSPTSYSISKSPCS